jgi:hypothetical protein
VTRRVYRSTAEDLTAPEPSPLDRAGATATALRAEDPELSRVRTLLAALRPDYPSPWEPLARGEDAPTLPRVRQERAPWDRDIPAGLRSSMGAALDAADALTVDRGAEVVARIDALPADAGAVLRWLRLHASLAGGLRGLWVDVGMAFASAAQESAWRDLTVRRGFAPAHGRRLVLAACEAWEREGGR